MKNICKIFLLVLIFSNFSISQEVKDYVKYQEPRKILFIGNILDLLIKTCYVIENFFLSEIT